MSTARGRTLNRESTRYDRVMTTVLVVDDEPMVRDVVARYLTREGFTVLEAGDGLHARDIMSTTQLDLVVLDVMLPEIGGLDLCRWIRDSSPLPVILLTARTEESDRIVGLELGADDYVTKPFSPRELVARVRASLRRAALPASPATDGVGGQSVACSAGRPPGDPAGPYPMSIVQGSVETRPAFSGDRVCVNSATRRVTVDRTAIELTAKEFDLLDFLVQHPGQVFTRGQLLNHVWGFDASLETGTATVTVHVRRLREKLENDPADPHHIQTVRGVGYRFEP